jgi:hypothetical protein
MEGGHRCAAAVVAKDVFVEVDLQVWVADAAVGAAQSGLAVGDGAVGARQQLFTREPAEEVFVDLDLAPLSGSPSGATIARRSFCRISQAVSWTLRRS